MGIPEQSGWQSAVYTFASIHNLRMARNGIGLGAFYDYDIPAYFIFLSWAAAAYI
jgi:hypothetical protein